MITEFKLLRGDILDVPSDLLLLKYAQARYGLDWNVASLLIGNGLYTPDTLEPKPGDYVIVDTHLPAITPPKALFLGTAAIGELDYEGLHAFARRAMEILAFEALPVHSITTTIHGVGFGLDAGEAVQHMVVGFLDGIRVFKPPLERIILVEKKKANFQQVASALESIGLGRANELPGRATSDGLRASPPPLVAPTSEITLEKREHMFVAIPFAEEFQDVYDFGIYEPIRRCGYICERVDESSFTGDVLERIKSRVESARLVIADLTMARPNVYLEVGYAWGRAKPVIFLAREGEKLHFDVKTHKCIYYRSIGQLARELERFIRGLQEHPTKAMDNR